IRGQGRQVAKNRPRASWLSFEGGIVADSYVRIRLQRVGAVLTSGRFLLLLLLAATRAIAGDVDLAWGPVAGASGYKIYYGPSVGNYPSHIDVGNTTAAPVAGLTEGATYYFVATAYDATGAEGGFSPA